MGIIVGLGYCIDFRLILLVNLCFDTVMAIEFSCPHCAQLLRVADESAGKTAKCPKCSGLAKIPDSIADAATSGFEPPPSSGNPPPDPFGGIPAAPNPFSDVGAADNPFAGSPPKAGSMFAPTGQLNPYSSPAPTPYSPYAPGYGFGIAGRTGLPWETQGQSLGTWWQTLTLILGSASDAFRRMHITGGLGKPIVFAMIGMGIGAAGQLVCQVGILGFEAAAGGRGEEVAIQMGLQVLIAIAQPLLGATLGCLIQAAILHVCLMMVGGEKNGYEATFRVCAYNAGVFGAFAIIPVLGPCVGAIWQIVSTIIGIAEAHETSGGKAALAFFLPLLVCGGLSLLLFVVLFGIVASSGQL